MAGLIRRFVRRVFVGPSEGDKRGTFLRRIADAIPNIVTANAKAVTGGGAAALVLWAQEQFGWDLSSWEPWIALAIAVAAVVWRTPNRVTEPAE